MPFYYLQAKCFSHVTLDCWIIISIYLPYISSYCVFKQQILQLRPHKRNYRLSPSLCNFTPLETRFFLCYIADKPVNCPGNSFSFVFLGSSNLELTVLRNVKGWEIGIHSPYPEAGVIESVLGTRYKALCYLLNLFDTATWPLQHPCSFLLNYPSHLSYLSNLCIAYSW
jgi:hypothetical protein